jgi:hypothetical protein
VCILFNWSLISHGNEDQVELVNRDSKNMLVLSGFDLKNDSVGHEPFDCGDKKVINEHLFFLKKLLIVPLQHEPIFFTLFSKKIIRFPI